MKNNFGDIEMKQEFGDKNKIIKVAKEWRKKTRPKYFGDFINVTNYFGDIANMAPKEKWYLAK